MRPVLIIYVVLGFQLYAQSQQNLCDKTIIEDSVLFSQKSYRLNWVAKKKLYHIAAELKNNHDCKIVVTGYGNNRLTCQQTSWDRVYSVIQYLRQTGVDSLRFIFRYAQEGHSPNVVLISRLLPGEDGPAMEMPPSPCYSHYGIRHKRCK